MPKIPTLDAPDVAPAGLPGADIHLDTRGAFGEAGAQPLAAANQAAGQLATEAMGVYARQQQKATDAATTNGATQLQETMTGLKHEGDDALFNRRGENAISGVQDYYDAIQGTAQDIQDKLPNEAAKRQFAMRSREMIAADRGQVERFTADQRAQMYQDTLTRNVTEGLKSIRLNYADEDIAATNYMGMATAAHQLAESDEARATRLDKLKGMVTATRIDAALHRMDPKTGAPLPADWETAQGIFQLSGSTLGEGREKALQEIRQAKATVLDGAEAQKIVYGNLDESMRPIDGAIDAKLREVDADRQEGVGHKVEEWRARATRAYNQVEADRLGRILEEVRAPGSLGSFDRGSDDFRLLSPDHKADVLAARETALRATRVDDRAAQAQQGLVDREELTRFSAIGDRRATANINSEFAGASQTARNTMQAQQNQVKALLVKGQGEPLHEFDEQVRAAGVGLNLSKQDGGNLKSIMDAWYMGQMADNGGKIPNREAVARELSTNLQQSKGWLGMGRSYRFQTDPTESFDAREDTEQPYQQYLKRSGTTPTVGPGTQAGSGGQRTAPAQPPPGVKRGSDGKLYLRNAAGKWAAYGG